MKHNIRYCREEKRKNTEKSLLKGKDFSQGKVSREQVKIENIDFYELKKKS